jgi:hypothetical protein
MEIDLSEAPSADERFAELVDRLSANAGVALAAGKAGFGSGTLTVDGRIFAMVTRGCLVIKMPRARVAELIEGGEAIAFDAGKGRPMKEWVAFETMPSRDRSLALSREALAFVAGRSPSAGAGQPRGDAEAAPDAAPTRHGDRRDGGQH